MIFFFFLDIGDPVSTLQSYVCLKKKNKKNNKKKPVMCKVKCFWINISLFSDVS